MKKILVLGCPGIGKKEFGKELSENTGILLRDIKDALYIDEKSIGKNVSFSDKICEMTKGKTWIIVGGAYEVCLRECDTVFFLDYSKRLCGEIIDANPERRITWGGVVRFHMDTRNKILRMLEKYSEKDIIVFRTEEEKESYIKNFVAAY